ncbi:gag pre-integrs domain-containing protein [Abeliophyllum distichum]|uniref:Gag pre-integrs domain-containing protein n=1 Tax=Abeliophyllum distichum TaxID=126358 RepID=A0ABD1UPL0_9LAMI
MMLPCPVHKKLHSAGTSAVIPHCHSPYTAATNPNSSQDCTLASLDKNKGTMANSGPEYEDLQSQKLIGTGRRQGGLYVLDELKVPVAATTSVDLSSFHLSHSSSSFYLWHSHLGHVSSFRLRFLVSTGALGNLQTCDISDCSGCKLAKFSALPFNRSVSVSSSPFDLIHSDVWGPSPVPTKGGS